MKKLGLAAALVAGWSGLAVASPGIGRIDCGISSPVLAENGTFSAPSYTFASDPDTGMYRVGANEWGMTAGGTQNLHGTSLYVNVPSGTKLSLDNTPADYMVDASGNQEHYVATGKAFKFYINNGLTDTIDANGITSTGFLSGTTIKGTRFSAGDPAGFGAPYGAAYFGGAVGSETTANYAFLGDGTSASIVNAPSGGTVTIRQGNDSSTDTTFTATAVTTKKPLAIGSGTAISKSLAASTTVDLASAAAGACTADASITVTGATVGAQCIVGPGSTGGATAGSQFTCYVSAADTVKLRHCCNNGGAGTCDPASDTYYVRVFNN